MSYNVDITNQAERDLRSIYEYYAFTRREPRLGKKIRQQIVQKLYSLVEMPNRYPAYQEEPWKSMGLRQVFAGSYCGLYFVKDNDVQVMRVLYGGMDISAVLDETDFDEID